MPKLIKHKSVAENPWVIIARDADPATLSQAEASHLLLPLALWQSESEKLLAEGRHVGVWLDSDETPAMIAEDLERLELVALNFPGFMDGRAYSSASILRQRYNYQGEIRAIGDVLRDQLFYMKRCGFDAFDVSDSVDIEDALQAFDDFSTSYMSTVEEPEPLFRRRA